MKLEIMSDGIDNKDGNVDGVDVGVSKDFVVSVNKDVRVSETPTYCMVLGIVTEWMGCSLCVPIIFEGSGDGMLFEIVKKLGVDWEGIM